MSETFLNKESTIAMFMVTWIGLALVRFEIMMYMRKRFDEFNPKQQ